MSFFATNANDGGRVQLSWVEGNEADRGLLTTGRGNETGVSFPTVRAYEAGKVSFSPIQVDLNVQESASAPVSFYPIVNDGAFGGVQQGPSVKENPPDGVKMDVGEKGNKKKRFMTKAIFKTKKKNFEYIRTPSGILKIVQISLVLVCLILYLAIPTSFGTEISDPTEMAGMKVVQPGDPESTEHKMEILLSVLMLKYFVPRTKCSSFVKPNTLCFAMTQCHGKDMFGAGLLISAVLFSTLELLVVLLDGPDSIQPTFELLVNAVLSILIFSSGGVVAYSWSVKGIPSGPEKSGGIALSVLCFLTSLVFAFDGIISYKKAKN